jgi:hypothetical protein
MRVIYVLLITILLFACKQELDNSNVYTYKNIVEKLEDKNELLVEHSNNQEYRIDVLRHDSNLLEVYLGSDSLGSLDKYVFFNYYFNSAMLMIHYSDNGNDSIIQGNALFIESTVIETEMIIDTPFVELYAYMAKPITHTTSFKLLKRNYDSLEIIDEKNVQGHNVYVQINNLDEGENKYYVVAELRRKDLVVVSDTAEFFVNYIPR